MSRLRVAWWGGASTRLVMGPFDVLFDPVFRDAFVLGSADVTRAGPMPSVDVDGIGLVALTCARTDHYDPDLAARVGAGVPLLVPEGAGECLEACGHERVNELAWGQSTRYEAPGAALTITAVAAKSGNGNDNGYFLSLDDAADRPATVYVTGDALFTDDVRLVQRDLGYANLLIPYLGAESAADGSGGSAGADDAMQFVYRMQPNAIVPVHHHTFSHYKETLDTFVNTLARTIYDRRLHVLAEGEAYERE